MTIHRDNDHLTGMSCDTTGCTNHFQIPIPPTTRRAFREISAERNWSTGKNRHGHNSGHDYCPPCTVSRSIAGDDLCLNCNGGTLRDLLGHDTTGHRCANALIREGIHDITELAALTDAELLDIRALGRNSIDHIRTRLRTMETSPCESS